ncbi:ABC transporter substrate-binding protein [Cetobacterium sp. SF1]|uniref:ABC transporter substrate-binding protein n=1 Tax=Cetobacterium sp. SF1 TaxID=3417654 RepID=UPI003CEC24E2
MKKILLFLFSLFIFISCSPKEEDKQTIVVANFADAKTLDPHGTNDSNSSIIIYQIYDRLVELDDQLNIIPNLVTSFEKIDDNTYLFFLKKNILFHDGSQLTSEDVKFSLERMKNSPRVSHIIEALERVDIIDDYSFKIKTTKPFAPFIKHLAHPASSILNKNETIKLGQKYGHSPIGTGPYKFISWDIGNKITLKSFNNYWKGETPIKNLIFKTITEGTNRTIALETGEADISFDIPIIDKDKVISSSQLILSETPGLNTVDLAFNNSKYPFNNPDIRQAFAMAIDVEAIIQSIYSGGAIKANAPIAPNVFGYDSKIKEVPYNPQKAKEILDKYNFKETITLELHDDQIRKDIATIIQAQLKDINIDINIEILEFGTSLERTAKGEYQMGIFGWTSVTGDTDYGLYPRFHSKNHGEYGNRVRYTNKKVDSLLDIGKSIMEPEKRKVIYTNILEIIQEDVPLFPLVYPTNRIGFNKKIKNLTINPSGTFSLYGISKD